MYYLVILSENAMFVINVLLVAASLGAAWVAIASYRHTRDAELAKQCDVVALDLKVEKKADRIETEEKLRGLHKRIDEKADKSLVESMDKKLDLILQKLD